MHIISSYLSERILLYDKDERFKKYKVIGRVPQNSVLGPLLWNVLYGGVLRLPILRSVQIVSYPDDIAITIEAKELHQIEATCMTTLARIKSRLRSANLQLAGQITEAILIMSRKKVEYITLN